MIQLPNKKTFTVDEVRRFVRQSYLAGVQDVMDGVTLKTSIEQWKDVVFNSVQQVTGLGREDLQRKTRKREIVDARNIVIYNLYPYAGSLAEIGREFGKDHTTIINSRNRYKDYYETDKTFREKAQRVQHAIIQQRNENAF
jgi:chromosomal replication initiation ATPase DnaA